MKRIRVLFEDGVLSYATVSEAMDLIKALYRTFYVHNSFDEWEDMEASYKLDEIEKWLNMALEKNKSSRRKLAAGFTICVN